MDTIHFIVSQNIRKIRSEKNISLEELAKISGVSKSMLAQIEKGKGNPSLSTLWKIANGLMIPFDALVARPQSPYEIVRLSNLDPIIGVKGVRNYVLFPGNELQKFSIYYMDVEPGVTWESDRHMRGTIEFITVFSGVLELTIKDKLFRLSEKDSIRFKADVHHVYKNAGEGRLIFHNILYNP